MTRSTLLSRASPAGARHAERPAGPQLCDGAYLETEAGRRLRVLGQLQSGGMGEIYAAFDAATHEEFVVKVPRQGGAEELTQWFMERELRLPDKLRHPHVVATVDRGNASGVPFLVMEYVDGRDLQSWTAAQLDAGSRPPWRETCRMIAEAAAGLAAAHECGIVHRDVKPANLMRCGDGTVKVLDWGLVRFTSDDAFEIQTSADADVGTFAYMSPEQVADPRKADARSDLYSLGCTFFFLLTGRPPFHTHPTKKGVMMAHRADPRPAVRPFRRDVPRRIDRLVQRMMAVEPKDRYADATSLLAALDRETARGLRGFGRRAANRTGLFAARQARKILRELTSYVKYTIVIGALLWGFAYLFPDRPPEEAVTKSGARVTMPAGTRERHPELVKMILESSAFDDEERQRWLKRLNGLDAEDRAKLWGHLKTVMLADIRGAVVVPPELRERYPRLVSLILTCESMRDSERSHWLGMLYMMKDEDRERLQEILEREGDELRLLDKNTNASLALGTGERELAFLIALANSDRVEDRRKAAAGFASRGSAARPALPVILRLIDDTDEDVKTMAAWAILLVAPEYADPAKREAARPRPRPASK